MQITDLFTRQEMALLTGIDDEVLAFWIKNGILVSSAGGAGKGSHRKFSGYQINIAGVISELRNFGINLAGLKAFAAQLQHGTKLAENAPCNFGSFHEAKELCRMVDDLKNHRTVTVFRNGEDVIAKTAADIVENFASDPRGRLDTLDNIVAFASQIKVTDLGAISLFEDLNGHGFGHEYEGRVIVGTDDWIWFAVRHSEDKWRINSGHAESASAGIIADNFRSGIFLSISAITRGIWGERLSPIIDREVPLSAEDKAKIAKMERHWKKVSSQKEKAHAAKVLRAATANAAKHGLGAE